MNQCFWGSHLLNYMFFKAWGNWFLTSAPKTEFPSNRVKTDSLTSSELRTVTSWLKSKLREVILRWMNEWMIENTHKVSLGVYLIEHMTSWIAKLINLQEEFTDYFLWIWFYFDIAVMGQIWCREQVCNHNHDSNNWFSMYYGPVHTGEIT